MSAHRFRISPTFLIPVFVGIGSFLTALAQEAPLLPSGSAPATTVSSTPPVLIEYDKQPLPADPDAALDLVRKANGLGSELPKPWYVKAHYQGFDLHGKPASKGTFTISWAAKDRYHLSYLSDSFHLEYYRTADGVYREGSSERLPYVESMLKRAIMYPIQPSHLRAKLKMEARKVGQVQLDCLIYDFGTSYCMDKKQLVLRASEQQGIGSGYNKIFIFQHHFLAEDINISDYSQPVLNIAVDELRALKPTEIASLEPPASAMKVDKLIDQDEADNAKAPRGSFNAGEMIAKVQPTYPAEAKARRAQGTVRMTATIRKDGTVSDLAVVRDPDPALSAAAIKCVSQWRYKPYLLNGQPVDVDTVVTVNFILGG